MASQVGAWTTTLAAAITIISTLGRARSTYRVRRNLEHDAQLLKELPDGTGKERLAAAINDRAQRLADRSLDRRFDLIAVLAILCGATLALTTFSMLGRLAAEKTGSGIPAKGTWWDQFSEIANWAGFVGAVYGLYLLGFIAAGRWLWRRADERARRVLRWPVVTFVAPAVRPFVGLATRMHSSRVQRAHARTALTRTTDTTG